MDTISERPDAEQEKTRVTAGMVLTGEAGATAGVSVRSKGVHFDKVEYKSRRLSK